MEHDVRARLIVTFLLMIVASLSSTGIDGAVVFRRSAFELCTGASRHLRAKPLPSRLACLAQLKRLIRGGELGQRRQRSITLSWHCSASRVAIGSTSTRSGADSGLPSLRSQDTQQRHRIRCDATRIRSPTSLCKSAPRWARISNNHHCVGIARFSLVADCSRRDRLQWFAKLAARLLPTSNLKPGEQDCVDCPHSSLSRSGGRPPWLLAQHLPPESRRQ